ncbi:MAG: enoyl-CoA hydratase/isomerase family protein [Candidatus Binatia bacterium]
MSEQAVYWNREGSVGVITLNRPARYNVLSEDVALGLQQAVRECASDATVRALILTGNGNAFCGGGDIKFMVAAREAGRSIESFDALFRILHGTIIAMRELPKPIIAALNGVAAGGGLGLALACDFRVASPKVSLLTAFLGIGASPDSSSSFFLPRYVGVGRATELFLRNKPVSAEEALHLGLVNAVVPPENVLDEAMTLAQELAQGPTAAFGRTKQLLNQSFNTSLQNHLHSEAQLITISAQAPDFIEGTNAFLAKRKAHFSGK